ncbi:MAG: UDP-N-acetylmuramate--L-alanine ligase [Bacteroidales bacterium]|nr:UDP-N-acetylmuramate--L-alanine ligase [Bacteroidales bacterium]MDY4521025.1 UDP-N-acetylmuramate--L-alanine ligase [Bacteroidales bacterium]
MSKSVYFIGIGGIGMSAIARHYAMQGYMVAGYDRTPSALTRELESEGIAVSYTDDPATIPSFCSDPKTMVVLTPAIPADNRIWAHFRNMGHQIVKRSQALGHLTADKETYCVAGTHGKTTTSTLAAHILRQSTMGCSAFLGGISVNYGTNYWGTQTSPVVVTEADEFDRSFLQLRPKAAVITAMDADHLDIYGTHAEVIKAFLQFAALVREGGTLIFRRGLPLGREDVATGVKLLTYAMQDPDADCHAENIRIEGGRYVFSVVTPMGTVADIRMGLPGRHNVENCVAAVALSLTAGVSPEEIRAACASFRGNKRRFEMALETDEALVIDDYAHHPQEIRTTLQSVRELYAGRRVTVAFQPHLYSRTRDLADDFAQALSMADRTWLVDIYPAREQPIEGVNSAMLLGKMKAGVGKLTDKEHLVQSIVSEPTDVVVVMGAGDIDKLVPEIAQAVKRAHNL